MNEPRAYVSRFGTGVGWAGAGVAVELATAISAVVAVLGVADVDAGDVDAALGGVDVVAPEVALAESLGIGADAGEVGSGVASAMAGDAVAWLVVDSL